MFEKIFKLSENKVTVKTEVISGIITFLTMSYIIFVQPAVLSGVMFNFQTGMDFGALTSATCLSAAIASFLMGVYANYPISLAPGMGENFFFVFTAIPAAAAAGFVNVWQTALGVVFISGIIFFIISLADVRNVIFNTISPSLKNGIAVGIGLFIAFIGLQNSTIIIKDPGTTVKLNPHFNSPDIIVFYFGLFITAALYVRRIKGAILWGIICSTAFAVLLKMIFVEINAFSTNKIIAESMLMKWFVIADSIFSAPPSLGPLFLKMDLKAALSAAMFPMIIIFLFMDIFDTMGTVVGVSEQAGFIKDNKLPRIKRVFMADAVGTLVGAVFGTSTVTSYIESCAGIEHGGRTGLTAVTVSLLFIIALFFTPIIKMVGSYPVITAPSLVIVGSLMIRNI